MFNQQKSKELAKHIGRNTIESPFRKNYSKRGVAAKKSLKLCPHCGHNKILLGAGGRKCSRCKRDVTK